MILFAMTYRDNKFQYHPAVLISGRCLILIILINKHHPTTTPYQVTVVLI